MLFKSKAKKGSCCSIPQNKCPDCGLEFKDQLPERCPRCNRALPRLGCQGCTHNH